MFCPACAALCCSYPLLVVTVHHHHPKHLPVRVGCIHPALVIHALWSPSPPAYDVPPPTPGIPSTATFTDYTPLPTHSLLRTLPLSLLNLDYTLQSDEPAQDASDEGSNRNEAAEVQPEGAVEQQLPLVPFKV